MDTAFTHSRCPASYSMPTATSTTMHLDSTIPQVRNDALVYLAIAVAGFAAVPTLFWLRDKRHKDKERRRNRAMLESLKAKMCATRPIASKAPESPTCAAPLTSPETSFSDKPVSLELDEGKEKKKRSKDRRKRGRDRELSQFARSRNHLPASSAPASVGPSNPVATDHTPRASEQVRFIDATDERGSPCLHPSPMPDITSPTPLSIISPTFHASSPMSPHEPSDTSSHPGQSRCTSVSPTTAPLTPPPLPTSVSLVAVKSQEVNAWLPQLSDIPRDDPAWDWDGQNSAYSTGSASSGPPSECYPVKAPPKQLRAVNKAVSLPLAISLPASPTESTMPSAPSLVFPSLNAHPPPGASLTTQIASLKGALEASRTREEKHRRDAERWSKECDLIKWRWNEAADMWRRREVELQTQIHHLALQLQTFNHAMQAASLSPSMSFMPGPGQTPFPLPMPFASHHGASFSIPPASASPDIVNEDLAEVILKRPESIRPPATSGSDITFHDNEEGANVAEQTRPEKSEKEEVIEFEFPTLLDRRLNSPQFDASCECETASRVDEVEIFH